MKSKTNNLLVVEDNPYIGEKIVSAAKSLNSIENIHLTKNLQEAMTSLKENNFELITLDLSLPDGNGIEILKWFTEEKIKKKVFVFSTSTELKEACLKYGAFAFFDKSNGFNDLIKNLESTS